MAGIYIHIPFCKQKCHYCDFHFSVSIRNKEEVLKAMHQEMHIRKNEFSDTVKTIYLGGGTPSVLDIKEIAALLETVKKNYKLADTLEITLEANPDDLNKVFIKDLYALGFNRLSIGVQSFFDEDLQFMNRVHTAKEAENSIKYAQNLGFENISIDLIYGVPGLSLDKWKKNLDTFIELNLPHLSSYALTVEDKTALSYFIKSKRIKALDENLAQEHFDFLRVFMAEHHYSHYELSNFAKKAFQSKHNTAYWQGETYLGFGPSAHSFHNNIRSWNIAHNSKYFKMLARGILPSENEILNLTERYNEYLMTGLRTMWGVSFAKIESEFGEKYLEYLLKEATKFIKAKHLIIRDNTLLVSSDSMFLIDGIISDLFWVE